MTIHNVEQRSEAWLALRVGRLTASRAADMLATIKTGEAAARRNLRAQLVLERITGKSQERDYVSGPMQDGIDREPAAVAFYEAQTGTLIQPVGFVSSDDLMAGCSPDGWLGEDGSVSIKSPVPATHLEYLKKGVVPRDYYWQVVHEFWISGRQWCDWLSFHPDFPEQARGKIVRVVRVEADVQEYNTKARAFLAEVETEVRALRTLCDLPAVLQEAV